MHLNVKIRALCWNITPHPTNVFNYHRSSKILILKNNNFSDIENTSELKSLEVVEEPEPRMKRIREWMGTEETNAVNFSKKSGYEGKMKEVIVIWKNKVEG